MPDDLLHGLTTEEWEELETFILDTYFALHGEVLPREKIGTMLFSFGLRFELPPMYRYMKWAQENEQTNAVILATLIHDLNGRFENPATFSPRTESY